MNDFTKGIAKTLKDLELGYAHKVVEEDFSLITEIKGIAEDELIDPDEAIMDILEAIENYYSGTYQYKSVVDMLDARGGALDRIYEATGKIFCRKKIRTIIERLRNETL